MKKTATLCALFASLASTTAIASDVLGQMTLTSDYLYRGVSESNGPSVSGQLKYQPKGSVFYMLAKATSLNSDDNKSSTKLESFIGAKDEKDGLGYNIGISTRSYSTSSHYYNDTAEFNLAVSYNGFELSAAKQIAHKENRYESNKATYAKLGYTSYFNGMSVEYYFAKNFGDVIEKKFGQEYSEAGIRMSRKGFTFSYVDTNLDDDSSKVQVQYSIEFSI